MEPTKAEREFFDRRPCRGGPRPDSPAASGAGRQRRGRRGRHHAGCSGSTPARATTASYPRFLGGDLHHLGHAQRLAAAPTRRARSRCGHPACRTGRFTPRPGAACSLRGPLTRPPMAATPAWRSPDLPIRVGISSCLLGEEVATTAATRRTPTHRRARAPLHVGAGVPRDGGRAGRAARADPAGRRRDRAAPSVDERDHHGAHERVRAPAGGRAAARELSGYILKRASPSCGLERVKVYRGEGPAARTGTGLFARALLSPAAAAVEEEGRLNDAHLRDNFITRVFAYRRFAARRESSRARPRWWSSTPRTSTCCSRTAPPPTRGSVGGRGGLRPPGARDGSTPMARSS